MVAFNIFFLAFLHSIQATNQNFTYMVTDLVKYFGNTIMVTEFSCSRKDSISLLKNMWKNGYQAKILPVNSYDIEYPIPPNHQVFTLNLQCKNSSNLLERADELGFLKTPFRWIIYLSNDLQISVDQLFSKINILVDSDVTLCQVNNESTVQVQKIYKKRCNFSIEFEDMGYWTKNGGYIDNGFETNTAKRRRNLKGTKLNTCIVITNNDSINHLTDKRDKHIDSIEKVNYVLVEHLKDIINASLNYSIQATWGYKNDELEWSGMIGELTRNEADIGGTPLFFTLNRVDIIDYIAMTTPTRSKFVFRKPKLSYVTNVYTLPFDDYVWLSSVFLVIILGFAIYITIKWDWKKVKYEKNKNEPLELKDSMADVTVLSIGAVCQQGAPAIPLSIPGRITTIILFISTFFLYTSYSANIVALLQSSSDSIRTLEDLLKSRLQIGVDDTVFNRFYFPNSTEPIRRALYLKKVAPPGKKDNFMSIQDGVKKLRDGQFAFHMETGPGYKIVAELFREYEKCGLQEIQFLEVIDPWLAIQKNSSYKKLLKIGLRKIQESGLQSREVGLIYTKKPVCTSRGSSFISVGIVDCYPAAAVLAAGLIAAVAVFLVEIYIHYRLFLKKKFHLGRITREEKNDILPYYMN